MTAVATTVAVSRGRPEVPLQVITPADVRASVRRAKKSLEDAAAEIVWQIEMEAWRTLGYPSWTAMREAEYGGAAFMVPSKSRPEIVARIKEIEVGRTARGNPKHLTDQEIASTVGVSRDTIVNDLHDYKMPKTRQNVDPEEDVIDAEIVEGNEHPGGNENWHTDYANGVRNDMEARTSHVIEYLDALAKHLPDDNVHAEASSHMLGALNDQRDRLNAAFKATFKVLLTEISNNRPTA